MAGDETTQTLHEHLEALGGELDTTALLQDLYDRDDVSVPWTTYILPKPDGEIAAKRVMDTYREYKDELSQQKLEELNARLSDELNRRASARRKRGDA